MTNITRTEDNHFELGYYLGKDVEPAKDVKVAHFNYADAEAAVIVVPVESRNVRTLYLDLPFVGNGGFRKMGQKAYANTEVAQYVTWDELLDVATA